MCGIAGIFHRIPIETIDSVLKNMQKTIAHRGQDGDGLWISDCAALAHVRLAILDINGGRQPMTTEDGRFVISYNGEIYNFKEIRQQLQGLGCQFYTDSDTEVLLRAWQQWGEACLPRLNGMFAFSIWDELEKTGCLARDLFGIKPLFFFHRKDMLLFASEAKAILAALSENLELDLNALHFLMNFRYLPGDFTLWKGIRQLKPGFLLRWTEDGFEIKQWGDLLPCTKDKAIKKHDIEDVARELIEDSVQKQLVSDVAIGGYLSYGIDSGIITAISAKTLREKGIEYPTFTIDTGDSPLEAKGAKETARYIGVPNFQEKIEINIAQWLKWLIWHLEVPKVNALQSALVASLASRHVKVALSGLGGDEIFLGYNIHKIFYRFSKINEKISIGSLVRPCSAVTKTLLKIFSPHFDEFSRGIDFLASRDMARAYGILRNVWDGFIERSSIYGPRVLDEGDILNPFEYIKEHWPGDSNIPPLKRLQVFELREKMVNDFLWNEDRVSMAKGLEVRVPFLANDLAEFVLWQDIGTVMADGHLKGLLKKIGREWLPKDFLMRPKSGFQVPAHVFFAKHLRPLCKIYLNETRVKREGLFNYTFIRKILDARPNKYLRWHYFLIYLMIGMSVWIELFENGSQLSPPKVS